MKSTALICAGLLLVSLCGCAGSQAGFQIEQGRRALLTGKPEIALQHFEQAAAFDKKIDSPLQEGAWTYVGRAYYASNQFPPARQALDRALAQDQDDDMARLYLGLVDAREQKYESARPQIHAGLQGVYNRIQYIKQFTFAGEYWDPAGRLSAELPALIEMVSAPPVNWSAVIPRIERLGLDVETEVEQVQRDEANRYRSGGSGGGDM